MELDKDYSVEVQHDEDTRLMVQAGHGDAKAFERLYRKYLPVVKAYLASHKGCHASLEDLTQEVFTRLWQNRGQFRKDSTLRTFLFGIARKVLCEQQRRLSKQKSANHSVFLKRSLLCSDGSSQPDLEVCRQETQEIVGDAISRLTAKQRQAVRVFYAEDTTSSKIMAQQANCSTESFRSRLRRGRSRLGQLLGHLEL